MVGQTVNGLVVTSGSEWRSGKLMRLPSGHTARLKKPDILGIIFDDGGIPDSVINTVMAGGADLSQIDMGSLIQSIPELMPKLKQAVVNAFEQPRVVDTPQDDNEIAYADVEFADRVFILQWAFEGVDLAIKFPEK
jgi:hypothetical protein